MLLDKLFLGRRKSDQESESPQTIPSVHQVTDNNNNYYYYKLFKKRASTYCCIIFQKVIRNS